MMMIRFMLTTRKLEVPRDRIYWYRYMTMFIKRGKRGPRFNHCHHLSRPYQFHIRHRRPIGSLLRQLIHISRTS